MAFYTSSKVVSVVMNSRQENLADFVRSTIAAKELSYRDVANRSGGLISHGTVSDVINCRSKDVGLNTLKGLAKGLGVPEADIMSAMNGKPADSKPKEKIAVLFHKFNDSDDDDLIEMEPIIAMLEAELDRRKRIREARGK